MYKSILIAILVPRLFSANICHNVVNHQVIEEVTFKNILLKIYTVVTIQNWDLQYCNKIAYIVGPEIQDFYVEFRNEKSTQLKYKTDPKRCTKNQTNCHHFYIMLDEKVAPNQKYNMIVTVIGINKIVPAKKARTFIENHLITYIGNLFYYSPYKTVFWERTYDIKNITDIAVSLSPDLKNEKSLRYSNTNLPPYSVKEIRMEFLYDKALYVVTNLERIIDVSHYGKITVEERIALKNKGSKRDGPFIQRFNKFDSESAQPLYTHLPASAENIQLFDTIGNNSKSQVMDLYSYKTLIFNPRYPLRSGWKTFYILKYKVPTLEYLYHDQNGKFLLRMRAVDHVLNNILIEKCSVKILLPEGAHNVKIKIPPGFRRLSDENTYTGLSSFGRITIVLNGSNIIENHIADFKVEYLFFTYYLLRAPLLIIMYLETIFICAIAVSYLKLC